MKLFGSEVINVITEESELFPIWKQALDEFIKLRPQYGDIVTKKYLCQKFEIKEPVTAEDQKQADLKFLTNFDKFKSNLLEQHQMFLNSLGKGQYQIVKPQDQGRLVLEKMVDGIKKEIKDGARAIYHTNTTLLNESQRSEHNSSLAKVATIKQMFNRRKLLGR